MNSFNDALASACALGKWPGECYNPTEAGGGYDAAGSTSTSQLLGVRATATNLATTIQPAFWMRPGEPHADPNPLCTTARNTTLLSDYRFAKEVQVGVAGIRHVIQFLSSTYVPEDVSSLTLEGPTGYLTGEFTALYVIDLDTDTFIPRSRQPPPANSNSRWYLPPPMARRRWAPGVRSYRRSETRAAMASSPSPAGMRRARPIKWNIVFRHGALSAGTTLSHRAYMFVGSLENVRVAMKQILRRLARLAYNPQASHQLLGGLPSLRPPRPLAGEGRGEGRSEHRAASRQRPE